MDVPRHVAIIPDGNRRWAKNRGLPIIEGHRRGSEMLIKLLDKAKELDIKIFTFWAFSTENWGRIHAEVDNLMKLYEWGMNHYLNRALKNKIRFIHIGRKDRLPEKLKKIINDAEEKTKKFRDYYFVLALDYGGHDEILRAIKRMENREGRIENREDNFDQFLDTKDLPYPNPDLVIRTSGERRTSGFMIWQAVYAEWIFIDKYFPDFTPRDFEECIHQYVKRQRRFGR